MGDRESNEEMEDAEVILSSSSEKEKLEKLEDRELGLELVGEEESGEGKVGVVITDNVGCVCSIMNFSLVGVAERIELEIMAKSSSASSCSLDWRSS